MASRASKQRSRGVGRAADRREATRGDRTVSSAHQWERTMSRAARTTRIRATTSSCQKATRASSCRRTMRSARTRLPLTLRTSAASIDVASVARQPPAPWWSGKRVAAAQAAASVATSKQQPPAAADYSLGQSDALLPFAPNSNSSRILEQPLHQPHHPAFAHLLLVNNRQSDFTADHTHIATAADSDMEQRGVAGHWQVASRLLASHAVNESLELSMSSTLSAACLAAIRPWPALCAPLACASSWTAHSMPATVS